MRRFPFAGFPREIYALFFVRLVVSAGSFINPFLAMLLTLKMGYNEAAAGSFLSAAAVVSAAGLLLGGKLGDVFGRKTVLASLQLVTAAAYGACALAGFIPITPFVIAFALGALSGTWPVINAVVTDVAPPERRKEAFALLYWGNNLGFSIGPLAAGFLFIRAPRLLFVGNAAVLTAAAVIVLSFVSQTNLLRVSKPARNPSPDASNTDGEPRGPTGETRPARESTFTVILRDPTLVLFALLSTLFAFVYNQHLFALPLFLRDILGADRGPQAFGAAMTVNGLTVVVCTALVTAVSRKLPSLLAVAAGVGLYALGFGSYALAAGLPFVLASTFVWTLGEILTSTNNNAFIAERAPESHRGRINGAVSFFYLIGNALAPLAAGPAIRAMGTRAIWVPVGVLAGVGGLATAGLFVFDRARGVSRPNAPKGILPRIGPERLPPGL